MAFSSKRISRTIAGNKIIETWKFDSAAVTGGVVNTGLSAIEHVSLNNVTTETGKAVPTEGSVTLSGLTANDKGTIFVIGY